MQTVTVRGVTLGAGRPKIIVPIVERTEEAVLAEARSFADLPLDMVEWRVDWFDGADAPDRVAHCLRALRAALGETPLLATFRTAREGGQRAIAPEDYAALCKGIAATGYADLLDVEAFTGDAVVEDILRYAHQCGVRVIGSSHNFQATPPQEELVARLRRIQALGADIPKLAVMPRSRQDVLALLAATEEMVRCYADRPIITMSMGGDGVISRLCGQVFGSAATFGCAARSSAPGQMEVRQLDTVLRLLEQAL
ncbi:MAG: type I 3-dehydroquinate dehydratase [Clostridiales bacterium]|nr:type I 3-dehydroquinate dehydratase [Clostridiales bacterium]